MNGPASTRSIIAATVAGALLLSAFARTADAQSAAVQAFLDKGDEAYDSGDYGRAATYYDRAIAVEPRSIETAYYEKRAAIFILRKEFDAGLRWMSDTAEPVKPKAPALQEKKALLLDGAGQDDEAAALAESLIDKSPEAFTLHLLLGNHHFERKAAGADRAVAAYDKYLEHRPAAVAVGDGMIRTKRGYALLYLAATGGDQAAARFDRARQELATVLAGDPTPQLAKTVHTGMCAALTGLESWKKAAAECSAVIEAHDEVDPATHYNLGVARLGLGEHSRARASVATFLAVRPESVRGHLLSGDIEAAARMLDAAELAYRRAGELAPDSPELALRLGRLHLQRDPPRLEEAADALRFAHDAYPDSIEVLFQLAETLQGLGHSEDAAKLAVEGAARPGLPAATRARMLVIAGDALYDDGTDLAGALGHYENALAAQPASSTARAGAIDTLNRIAVAFPDAARADARKALVRALELDAASAISNFNLGVLLFADREPALAQAHLEKAAVAAPGEARISWLLAQVKLAGGDAAGALPHYRTALADAGRTGDVESWALIGTELGGLLTRLDKADEAVTLLDQVRTEGGEVGKATELRRHLAVAYLHRGLGRLDVGQNGNALADLEKADGDKLLEGDETQVHSFATAVARLRQGRIKEGRRTLEALAKRLDGHPVPWLNSPYDKLGVDYYIAYSYYLEDTKATRKKAVTMLEKLAKKASGSLRTKVKTLLRSAYQLVAYHLQTSGKVKEARKMLEKARDVSLPGKDDPVLLANLAVLEADRSPDEARRDLEKLGDDPPEALVNLGILLDRDDKPLEAYRVWKVARDKGARAPHLAGWIEAIEKLLGPNPDAGDI